MKFRRYLFPRFLFVISILFAASVSCLSAEQTGPFRLGVIGTTTSHVPAFVGLINAPEAEGIYKDFEVTVAYPGGMPDNPDSWNRLQQYKNDAEKKGVKIVSRISELLEQVDGVLLESVDGRCHLEQARPVIEAGKPLYIDKPIAGTLADTLEIYRLAGEKKVPVFSSSSLRFSSGILKSREANDIRGAAAWSPSSRNDKHPGLPWYGIHGVETLFTIMKAGCESVSCTMTDSCDLAVGVWKDGRIGTFRGDTRGKGGYGATIYTDGGHRDAGGYEGYKPLVEQICLFFQTGQAPFPAEETLEIMAFMEAAERSASRNGESVSLAWVMEQAKTLHRINVSLHLDEKGRLLLDGKETDPEKLPQTLNALLPAEGNPNNPNSGVFVSLTAHDDVEIERVQEIANRLGRASLAWFSRTGDPKAPR